MCIYYTNRRITPSKLNGESETSDKHTDDIPNYYSTFHENGDDDIYWQSGRFQQNTRAIKYLDRYFSCEKQNKTQKRQIGNGSVEFCWCIIDFESI